MKYSYVIAVPSSSPNGTDYAMRHNAGFSVWRVTLYESGRTNFKLLRCNQDHVSKRSLQNAELLHRYGYDIRP